MKSKEDTIVSPGVVMPIFKPPVSSSESISPLSGCLRELKLLLVVPEDAANLNISLSRKFEKEGIKLTQSLATLLPTTHHKKKCPKVLWKQQKLRG